MTEPTYTCPTTNKPCEFGLPCEMFHCANDKTKKAIRSIERCAHCGAGDDNHHSHTCPSNLHPDKIWGEQPSVSEPSSMGNLEHYKDGTPSREWAETDNSETPESHSDNDIKPNKPQNPDINHVSSTVGDLDRS